MPEVKYKDARARDSEVLMAFVDTLPGLSGSLMQCASFFMCPRDGDVFYLVACVSLMAGGISGIHFLCPPILHTYIHMADCYVQKTSLMNNYFC